MKATLVVAFLGFNKNSKIIKMEKLNFEQKLALAAGTFILAAILLYSIPINLDYSFSYFFNKENKEKIIELNNKKYSGRMIKSPLKYIRYVFVHPPTSSGDIPRPCYFNESYYSNLNEQGYDFTLDKYEGYKNNQLECIVNNPTNPEFSAREDTLRMLIGKFNSN